MCKCACIGPIVYCQYYQHFSFLLFSRSFTNRFPINFTSLNKLVFAYFSIRSFTDGLEEFIIQPTAWYYMKYLGETNAFLGLTVAAYSIGTLVFAPFIGFLEAKCASSKAILLMCGLVKLSGNVLYAIPINGYFPLFGRFISGIGEGTLGVLYGAVTKCTTHENRAKAFLYFEGLYSIGSICGPTIGSVLTFNLDILGKFLLLSKFLSIATTIRVSHLRLKVRRGGVQTPIPSPLVLMVRHIHIATVELESNPQANGAKRRSGRKPRARVTNSARLFTPGLKRI